LAELSAATALGDPSTPHSAEETAWSEFGHHVSGLFVLAMGVLAMLERTGRAPWARHWPLLLIGLTGFVAWNMDPEGWQTGRIGFWEHLLGLEVLQHRILLAFTAILGVAEWRVRSGRHPESRWRYVFPFVCIGSGILLLSHAHEVSNAKSAFLIELTHLPLGPRHSGGRLVALARAAPTAAGRPCARAALGTCLDRVRAAPALLP
jgi:putative copper resistance protein D